MTPTHTPAMGPAQLERIAKALADDRRFEILEAIANRDELACRAVVERFPISQATVSHHLKELQTAGLVDVRQEGQAKFYRVRRDTLEGYLRALQQRLLGRR